MTRNQPQGIKCEPLGKPIGTEYNRSYCNGSAAATYFHTPVKHDAHRGALRPSWGAINSSLEAAQDQGDLFTNHTQKDSSERRRL